MPEVLPRLCGGEYRPQLFRMIRDSHVDMGFNLGVTGVGAAVGALLAWLIAGTHPPACALAAVLGGALAFVSWRTFDVDAW